jgi:hypothetical protein
VTFIALVRLYLRDLVRRRLLWGIALIALLVFAIGHWTSNAIEDAMGQGESFATATRQTAARLDGLANEVREWLYIAVVLVAAQVATESRKNGTTQFVLTSGVGRTQLAAAQFAALSIILGSAIMLIHIGFAVAFLRARAFVPVDAAVGWFAFVAPMLAGAACVFSVSLTAGSIETYLLFFGVPLVARSIPTWMGTSVKHAPPALVRFFENVAMLFPSFADLARWPHLSPPRSDGAPFPHWGWTLGQAVLATAFWILLGVFVYQRHDFGSRTATK